MNEEELEQEEQQEEQEEQENTEAPEFDYQATQEEKARKAGWLPQEEYLAAGKNPMSWTPAPEFNMRGEFINKMKSQETRHGEEIANLNQFHQLSMKNKIEELQREKEDIIRKGEDTAVEDVKNIDHQISSLQAPAQTQAEDPALTTWKANNPWINTPGAKSTYAYALYNHAANAGQTTAQCIAYMDQEIAKEFPPKARNKETAAMSEKGNGPKPASQAKSGKLTMSDVTAEELRLRSQGPASWSDDAKFLKAVENSRKL